MSLLLNADRALTYLWGLLDLPHELTLILQDTDTTYMQSAEINLPPDGLTVKINLNREYVRTGADLWATLAHECLHLHKRELHSHLDVWEETGALPTDMIRSLRAAEELSTIRAERLFLKGHPCPKWLREQTYTGEVAE